MPNPWDRGSAKLFASLGFEALATTSSGSAATLGLLDGSLSREEALANAAAIVRLQAYEEAGADVLYAPGIARLEDIRQVVGSVGLPLNVLARPGVPRVAELAQAGVRRISVGGAFALAGLGAVTEAARQLIEEGTYGYLEQAGVGLKSARAAFASRGSSPPAPASR